LFPYERLQTVQPAVYDGKPGVPRGQQRMQDAQQLPRAVDVGSGSGEVTEMKSGDGAPPLHAAITPVDTASAAVSAARRTSAPIKIRYEFGVKPGTARIFRPGTAGPARVIHSPNVH